MNADMANTPRFEIRLPTDRRQELETLAIELGTSVSELLRIGGRWVLTNRKLLVHGPAPQTEKAA